MTTATRKDSGFTIIEVVLVLAIAGLIFLVVFLALPQLQRSQRDSQRRSDAGRFLSAAETYASNNNGEYPDNQNTLDDMIPAYLTNDGALFEDPSGNAYDPDYGSGAQNNAVGPNDEPDGTMLYRQNAQCGDEGDFDAPADGGDRKIAVMVPLENGIAYCQDNR